MEISVTDVDYSDPGIQDARNGKQKALETAAANLATAQGKAAADLAAARGEVNAANELSKLYKTPSWVQLQLAE